MTDRDVPRTYERPYMTSVINECSRFYRQCKIGHAARRAEGEGFSPVTGGGRRRRTSRSAQTGCDTKAGLVREMSPTRGCYLNLREKMVGVAGFEPATPASRTQCSTRLSHTPTSKSAPYSEANPPPQAIKRTFARPVACPASLGYLVRLPITGAARPGGRQPSLGDGVMVTLRFLVPSF